MSVASDTVDARRPAAGADMAQRAGQVLAGGTTHDSWLIEPCAPVFVSASGAWKQDAEGKAYIDLWNGHGALFFGHGDPAVMAAVARQLALGTHFGGLSRIALEWAEVVQALIPSAERVRFTSSGSEATQLALRVARAFTGRRRIVRLDGHYHGWHEPLLQGVAALSGPGSGMAGDANAVTFCHPDDLDAVAEELAADDVAALILEPGGGGSGALDWSRDHLTALRALCDRYGTLLIFDEVISAFRYAPGGVQALSAVVPDLTTLAKILCGGLPGGALVGRRAVMEVFGPGTERPFGPARVTHAGTFNGFPLAAAAGLATLARVKGGEAQARADRAAQLLCDGVNAEARRLGIDAALFRNSSTVHLIFDADAAGIDPCPSAEAFVGIARGAARARSARRALLAEGIDMHPTHGWVSAVHDDAVIEQAIAGFARAFARMQAGTA